MPLLVHLWKTLGKLQKTMNTAGTPVFFSFPKVFQRCTRSGTQWKHCWGHCNHTVGKTAKYTLNEPLRNTTGAFFGKLQGLPINYPPGTPKSHDMENCKHTRHFLSMSHSGTSQGNCSGNFECTCSVPGGIILSTLSISLGCLSSVPAGNTTPCPQWKPRSAGS